MIVRKSNNIRISGAFSFILLLLFFFVHANAQFPGPSKRETPLIEFLGWDYDKLGYALSPGEDVTLLFRNNSQDEHYISVNWKLETYLGKYITEGESKLNLIPGETGRIPVDFPMSLQDGPYNIIYSVDGEGWEGEYPFFIDYRKPDGNTKLNLNLVAFIENMDKEGWVRMMFGPLARLINVKSEFPENQDDADAVVVMAEALDFFSPKFEELQNYVRTGGTALVFGKTAPVFFDLLPVDGSDKKQGKNESKWLREVSGDFWPDFEPDRSYLHYPIQVQAKKSAEVLAQWSDGTPAVVSGKYGAGKVIYVGTGSYQVWQDNPSLIGADELALRILYNEKGGPQSVDAMLKYAQQLYSEEKNEEIEIRDEVFNEFKGIQKPDNFMVVSKDNMGRFGWMTSEGGLTENIEGKCRITPVRTQETYTTIPYPVFDYSFKIGNEIDPNPVDVNQNWFAKTIRWEYPNGEILTSTLSLGTPGILWEGKSEDFSLSGSNFTHVVYPVKGGVKVLEKGEKIDISEWNENWLLTLMAVDSIRDMPRLVVFTNRPREVIFDGDLSLSFGDKGFQAMFTSRLYGIKRFAPGETINWHKSFPSEVKKDAGKWSKIFLNFPVKCDEIGWVEDDMVSFADKVHFREFSTDWDTKPLKYTVIPPLYILAANVGSPVEFPEGLVDLNCPTKYGPLKGIKGSSSLIRVQLPPTDHRAVIPTEEEMVLEDMINRNVAGIDPNSLTYNDQLYDHNGGEFVGDLYPYEISHEVPYYEAPQLDLYKWWLVFNAVLARPVYNDSVKNVVDNHFQTRYWETLNYYPHKSLLIRKREPWTQIEYMTTFVWPTNTENGWRYTGDVQESSAVNTYCYTNYARYYGDWTTIRANWNLCRELHDFLTETMDWACLSTGAREYWNATGIDMANSEPYGRLAFAYAADVAGYPEDALRGKIGGARSLITAVSRLGVLPYLHSISAEGDPWFDFQSANFINEFGVQLTKGKRGGIGWLDTSKGAMHELALAYKEWAGKAMNQEQKEIAEASRRTSLCDLTQRLFLGWDRDSLLNQVVNNPRYHQPNPSRFTDAADLYDMAVLSLGNLPVFLSDWAPAELKAGTYDTDKKEMKLFFQSHLGESFDVEIYSRYKPVNIDVNGETFSENWSYDDKTGWLKIDISGDGEQKVTVRFGQAVAPLHPYFSGISKN